MAAVSIGLESIISRVKLDPEKMGYRIISRENYEVIKEPGIAPHSKLDLSVYRLGQKYTFAFPGVSGITKWFDQWELDSYMQPLVVSGLILSALRGSQTLLEGLVIAFPIKSGMYVSDYFHFVAKEGNHEAKERNYIASIVPFEQYRGSYKLPELLVPCHIDAKDIQLLGGVSLKASDGVQILFSKQV